MRRYSNPTCNDESILVTGTNAVSNRQGIQCLFSLVNSALTPHDHCNTLIRCTKLHGPLA